MLTRRAALARLGLGAAAVYTAPVVLDMAGPARADEHEGRGKGKQGAGEPGRGKGEKAGGKAKNFKKGWAKKGYGQTKGKDKGKGR